MFNWKPEPYTSEDDYPEIGQYEEGHARDGDDIPCSGRSCYVTCNGRRQVDKENLQGMKMTRPSRVPVGGLPWLGNKESWLEPVTLDLGLNSLVGLRGKKQQPRLYLECRAMAKNIPARGEGGGQEDSNGGALATLCFMEARFIK
eukprot:TRINITY_DN24779_c0_g1_i1.p1 TRINITY_DN24779_c0_g1~~TRINITY_DN24779_c0_g1_i1.p1  ORF type:complete len:145 (-),score=35.13 TRINITY_DN24779_c0_g1_i1:30-464(-)